MRKIKGSTDFLIYACRGRVNAPSTFAKLRNIQAAEQRATAEATSGYRRLYIRHVARELFRNSARVHFLYIADSPTSFFCIFNPRVFAPWASQLLGSRVPQTTFYSTFYARSVRVRTCDRHAAAADALGCQISLSARRAYRFASSLGRTTTALPGNGANEKSKAARKVAIAAIGIIDLQPLSHPI